jgi:hypothetical protein
MHSIERQLATTVWKDLHQIIVQQTREPIPNTVARCQVRKTALAEMYKIRRAIRTSVRNVVETDMIRTRLSREDMVGG